MARCNRRNTAERTTDCQDSPEAPASEAPRPRCARCAIATPQSHPAKWNPNRPSESTGCRSSAIVAARASILERLPQIVLISPLCARVRKGCARSHDGSTLVAIPLMEKRDRRLEFRVRQVGIELRQQPTRAKRLVDHRCRRNTRNVARQPRTLKLLPRQKEPAIESRRHRRRDQQVPHRRAHRVRNFAQNFRTHRHRPPHERFDSLRCERASISARCAASLRRKRHTQRPAVSNLEGSTRLRQKPGARNHDSNPTPSLDFPSAATAPRCSSRASAVSACCRMSCEGSPESRATKPTPQESKSKRGSTRLFPR